MSLNSMTGFARAGGEVEPFTFQWEIRSVNGRGLDARFRLPPGFEALEPELRARLGKAIKRGSVQVSLSCDIKPGMMAAVEVNAALLDQLLAAALAAAKRAADDATRVDVGQLMRVRGVLDTPENGGRAAWAEEYAEALLAAFDEAVQALAAARAEEGARIEAVIRRQLAEIARLEEEARHHPARQPEAIRERLREQVARLLEASEELDAQRLHQEAVLLAVRADITEELDRLRAHLKAADELLAAREPAGRKLEFLAQEFHREANTLCSKANDAGLSAIGMALKAAIDQLREQAANVE